MDIPSHWLILSQKEINENPDAFKFKGDIFKNFDKTFLEKVRNEILLGSIEIIITNDSTAYYTDHITVAKTVVTFRNLILKPKRECHR